MKTTLLVLLLSSALYGEEFSKEMQECIRQGTRAWNANRELGIGPLDENACLGNLRIMRPLGGRACREVIEKCTKENP